MKKYFSFLMIFLCLMVFSCNSPYGKKVKINDRIEVFIKDGATEDEAKKLGNYIDTTWKNSSNKKSFQLLKDSGQYTVRMVVDEDKIKHDSSLDASFMAIQFLIEENVFKGSKVRLILTDNQFKDIKTFKSSPPELNEQDKTTDSAHAK
ncbi:MAG: hypothetical protein JWO92_1088 [Chitinophagaceae bacterium]|nr:hypothetical protein [Chitinophagaceae bacterium]